MAGFLTPLRLERPFDRDDMKPFVVLEPLLYESDLLPRVVEVPSGFETDLASIPRFFWRLYPPFGRYDGAAVVHDWLYYTNGVTRDEADAVFSEAMEVSGVGWWTRVSMYRIVRVFGRGAWSDHRAGRRS